MLIKILCVSWLTTHLFKYCTTSYIYAFFTQGSRCANQIEEVCKDIEKTINQTVQNTLNTLERDCNQISQIVEEKLREDR